MPINLRLSKRLKELSTFIPTGSRFADIGSDHAYLPSYVCLKDPSAFAVAGEVQPGPFNSAKKTIEAYGLANRVDVRLGDGLEVIQTEDRIDTIVIAGMGGKLIKHIFKHGIDKLQTVDRLIVQPNTDEYEVRRFFMENNFQLLKEIILTENDHIYEIMMAERTTDQNVYQTLGNHLEMQLMFGPLLLQEKSTIFLKKWQQEYTHLKKVLQQLDLAKNRDIEKRQKLQRQMAWIEEVLQ